MSYGTVPAPATLPVAGVDLLILDERTKGGTPGSALRRAGSESFDLVYSFCERAIGFDGVLDVSCDFLWLWFKKVAGRLGAAPSRLGFGDPVAQAGARPNYRFIAILSRPLRAWVVGLTKSQADGLGWG